MKLVEITKDHLKEALKAGNTVMFTTIDSDPNNPIWVFVNIPVDKIEKFKEDISQYNQSCLSLVYALATFDAATFLGKLRYD